MLCATGMVLSAFDPRLAGRPRCRGFRLARFTRLWLALGLRGPHAADLTLGALFSIVFAMRVPIWLERNIIFPSVVEAVGSGVSGGICRWISRRSTRAVGWTRRVTGCSRTASSRSAATRRRFSIRRKLVIGTAPAFHPPRRRVGNPGIAPDRPSRGFSTASHQSSCRPSYPS